MTTYALINVLCPDCHDALIVQWVEGVDGTTERWICLSCSVYFDPIWSIAYPEDE